MEKMPVSDMPFDWECGLNLSSLWIQKMFSDPNHEFEVDAFFFCLTGIHGEFSDGLDFAISRMAEHPVCHSTCSPSRWGPIHGKG